MIVFHNRGEVPVEVHGDLGWELCCSVFINYLQNGVNSEVTEFADGAK